MNRPNVGDEESQSSLKKKENMLNNTKVESFFSASKSTSKPLEKNSGSTNKKRNKHNFVFSPNLKLKKRQRLYTNGTNPKKRKIKKYTIPI